MKLKSVPVGILIHWCLLILGLTFLFLKGFLEFKTHYDYLAYHLPFALTYYDLTTFTTYPGLLEWFKGYPPLAHRFQGFLIWATGSLSASTGANTIFFVAVLGWIKHLLPAVPLRWFLTIILAVPLTVIHLPSGYLDFWIACACLLMFAGILSAESGLDLKNGATVVFGAAIGVFSKYQAWAFIGLVGFLFLVRHGYFLLRAGRKRDSFLLAAGLGLAVCVFPLVNTIKFHTPMYPIQFGFLQKIIPKQESLGETGEQMPDSLRSFSKPTHFVLSVFEVSRFQFPGFKYSIDQGFETGTPHFRMGGWGFYTVLAILVSALIVFLQVKRSRVVFGYLASFVCLLAFMPANHELRYWLMVPFCFALTICFYLRELPPKQRQFIHAIVSLSFLIATIEVRKFYEFKITEPEDVAPGEAKDFWRKNLNRGETFEVRNELEKAIFWSGPTFRELKVKAIN